MGIKTYIHELSGELNQYFLTEDTYPHDIEYYKKLIQICYESTEYSDSRKKSLAIEWFEKRKKSVDLGGFYSFTKNQKIGHLPKSLNQEYLNIVIFNSSEDEFAAIDGWENPFYADQNQGIFHILRDLENEKNIRFFLRMHPNLTNITNSQTQPLQNLSKNFKNIEVISCDSSVSTYSLINACDIVITFGSTVGIEAVYQEKPSILLGRAVYEDLGAVIKPKSHADLVFFLKNFVKNNTFSKSEQFHEAVYKYGFFQQVSGTPLRHSVRKSLFRVTLKRENSKGDGREFSLRANLFSTILSKTNL